MGALKTNFRGKIMAKPVGKATVQPAHHLQKLTRCPEPRNRPVRHLGASGHLPVHTWPIRPGIASWSHDVGNL